MSHSNTSLNCFANCQSRYKLNYIDHVKVDIDNPHFRFGTMAHDVLYKAGKLRDEGESSFDPVIPSEVVNIDLKNYFNIKSWTKYFHRVIQKIAQYENECMDEVLSFDPECKIEREVRFQMTPDDLKNIGVYGITQPLVGIIDCLLYNDQAAVIIDYKFSSERKGIDVIDQNSQLMLYAFFVHHIYKVPLRNIKVGYIDVPKEDPGQPALLTNGTLSRAKNQNCTQELYEKAVIAVHGPDDPKYNCKPGGHYYEAWCNMACNQVAYMTMVWLDTEAYNCIVDDLLKTAQFIDLMTEQKFPFLRKYDSYSCKNCEYLQHCKPWLTVGGFE